MAFEYGVRKYAIMFVMDDNGVEHHQMPKTVKKYDFVYDYILKHCHNLSK